MPKKKHKIWDMGYTKDENRTTECIFCHHKWKNIPLQEALKHIGKNCPNASSECKEVATIELEGNSCVKCGNLNEAKKHFQIDLSHVKEILPDDSVSNCSTTPSLKTQKRKRRKMDDFSSGLEEVDILEDAFANPPAVDREAFAKAMLEWFLDSNLPFSYVREKCLLDFLFSLNYNCAEVMPTEDVLRELFKVLYPTMREPQGRPFLGNNENCDRPALTNQIHGIQNPKE